MAVSLQVAQTFHLPEPEFTFPAKGLIDVQAPVVYLAYFSSCDDANRAIAIVIALKS